MERPDPVTLKRMRAALNAMDRLPRTVFERVRFGGAGYAQIGADLGITVGEVEAHFAAALLHLSLYMDCKERR
jgi:DNA-directed RNA polymerase specialized sigma24 family protein